MDKRFDLSDNGNTNVNTNVLGFKKLLKILLIANIVYCITKEILVTTQNIPMKSILGKLFWIIIINFLTYTLSFMFFSLILIILFRIFRSKLDTSNIASFAIIPSSIFCIILIIGEMYNATH